MAYHRRKKRAPRVRLTAEQERAIDGVLQDIRKELESAYSKHGPMKSAHEGFSVLNEEVFELWLEVIRKKAKKKKLRAEAIQVAAMGSRFVLDCCGGR